MDERILLAVDESPASQKATDYLAAMIDGRPHDYVHVVHVLPPLPRTAAESGIAPESPDRIDAYVREQKEKARAMLEATRDRLCAAGMSKDHVDIGYLTLSPELSVAEGTMDVARDNNCGTIVVGRNSLPWYRELFHAHPADELVKKARDVTVWIVE